MAKEPAESPTWIEVGSVPAVEEVADIASKLRRADPVEPIGLDFSGLDASASTAPSFVQFSLLSSLLLSRYRKRALRVVAPKHPAATRLLARAGVWFSVAQRPDVRVDPAPDEAGLFAISSAVADATAWRSRWDPSDQEFRSRAWGRAESGSGSGFDTVSREFLAFVNPHLSVSRDRLIRELNNNIAERWLANRLADAPSTFLAAASEAITELLYNFSVHPFTSLPSRPPLQRDVPKDRRFGMMSLDTTSGGGGERLHIVCSDTGHGIPATLRPKLRAARQPSFGSDRELLISLLAAELPAYGRSEGRGFPRLLDFAHRYGGSLEVITNSDDEIGGTLVGRVRGDAPRPTVSSLPQFEASGTTVRLTLSLQAVAAASSAGAESAD
jgi:hypothetical protein